jgi:hypothetical protein
VDVVLVFEVEQSLVLEFSTWFTLFIDVVMTIAGTEDVRARVVYVDPVVGLAVLKYNPGRFKRIVDAIGLAIKQGDSN